MSRSTNHLAVLLAVVSLVLAACSAPGPGNRGGMCAPLPASKGAIVDLTEGRPIHPELFVDGSQYVLFANELIFGGMRVPVLRYESTDGVNFTGPTRIVGSDDWWSPSVVRHDGTWFLFYKSSRWDSGLASDGIGLATSSDTVNWTDQGIVFDGPGAALPGTDTLTVPKVWHDGERFHLYVTGWTEWEVGDIGRLDWSILHAVSDDGLTFTYEGVPFAARECIPSTGEWEQFAVGGMVRNTCGDELCADELALLVRHNPCGTEDMRLEVVISSDGYAFSEPTAFAPDHPGVGTALANDETLWLYSDVETADHAADGHIFISEVDLSTSLCGPPAEPPEATSNDSVPTNAANENSSFQNNWAANSEISCIPSAMCELTCPAGETCGLVCHGSGCAQTCEAGAQCEIHCVGGGCEQRCEDGATCDASCEGGSCTQTCSPSATCAFSCAGGDCDA